ncbi:flagellar assembly protein FliW [Lysinibacillus capsici]|uniref:flagellar assembly protein FliW n=1 Tax=Lysinibacillus capsici TaxID=2115968 RepID=UPI0032E4A047
MQIQTKLLGEVVIDEKEILTFERGLPGFPTEKRFVLLPIDSELPIAILQSINDASIGFVIAYPYTFKTDYAFDISEEDIADLQIESEEDVVTYAIVTLKDSLNKSTLNLLAPIIINIKKKLGKQIVLNDNHIYPLHFPFSKNEV